jgi:ubiquinol-cytochrome c reductase cytochrome b subunit
MDTLLLPYMNDKTTYRLYNLNLIIKYRKRRLTLKITKSNPI